MQKKNVGATVISLETHPAWLAAHPDADALEAAKRRHPSYQAVAPHPVWPADAG
ncbi:hypothetical protein [Mycolicibacterium wolinskyi]|uniref:hypothetical protein n=1 Tax=Mycolicibacterium wolinskyi TaxID=59750 RepID=UPI000AF56AF9|nr:hypothetical protein [Mycolicibacterium wolinskyi]